jgi:hypothetical protein
LKAGGDELPREDAGVTSPSREEATPIVCGEPFLTVGADILQKQVTEGDRLDLGQGRARERLGHARLIDIVDARGRDANLDELR